MVDLPGTVQSCMAVGEVFVASFHHQISTSSGVMGGREERAAAADTREERELDEAREDWEIERGRLVVVVVMYFRKTIDSGFVLILSIQDVGICLPVETNRIGDLAVRIEFDKNHVLRINIKA